MPSLPIHKLYINAEWIDSGIRIPIKCPYTKKIVSESAQATSENLESAIVASTNAFSKFKKTSRYVRSQLLSRMAGGIEARRTDFCQHMVNEAGKPNALANAEISRAIGTFTLASEEAKRFCGSIMPVDFDSTGCEYSEANINWVPHGPLLAITPFNFPLNLLAHKVAPALAAGCTVIAKPAPQTPGCANLLAEIYAAVCGELNSVGEKIPVGAFQVVHASNEVISAALTDSRIPILSFTGSDTVGWTLKEKAFRKKVVLELGGNAAVIIDQGANLKRAAARCAFGGYAYAGQICISVQRIYVHQNIFSEFQSHFLEEISKIGFGDPNSQKNLVGPLIDLHSASRVSRWIEEAVQSGSRILLDGRDQALLKNNNLIKPTVLTGVPTNCQLVTEEVFGPLTVLESYEDLDKTIGLINQSRYGLQAGIFTQNLEIARKATEDLEVGGVLLNEVPTYRADNLPYGGIKDSGVGREGVRWAMEEFCGKKYSLAWKD